MPTEETPSITHAIALQNEGFASELGPTLWSVLAEVSSFYDMDEKTRARFDRKWVGRPQAPVEGGDPAHFIDVKLDTSWWHLLQRSGKLIDQERLARQLRSEIPAEGNIITITDAEITPPPEWRYIIWESFDSGDAVISFAPLDPKYWGDPDPDRINTIKRRVRAALLGVTGSFLGLEECDNTRCFLYSNVDSVSVLDNMIAIGLEHDAPGLTGKVFSGKVDDTLGLESLDEAPTASLEYDPL